MDGQQINPSCLFSYLNIRGLGHGALGNTEVRRYFNALPYLSYWSIYRNYYANKQEGIGAIIHKTFAGLSDIDTVDIYTGQSNYNVTMVEPDPISYTNIPINYGSFVVVKGDLEPNFDPSKLIFHCIDNDEVEFYLTGNNLFSKWEISEDSQIAKGSIPVQTASHILKSVIAHMT